MNILEFTEDLFQAFLNSKNFIEVCWQVVQAYYQGNSFIKWLLHTPLKVWFAVRPGVMPTASQADRQPVHIQVQGSKIKPVTLNQGWN